MVSLLLSADSTRCSLGRRARPLRNHRTPAPSWEVWQVRATELPFSTRFRLGDTMRGLVSISGNTQRHRVGVRDPFPSLLRTQGALRGLSRDMCVRVVGGVCVRVYSAYDCVMWVV